MYPKEFMASRKEKENGFSLLEMVITLSIALIMCAITFVAMKPMLAQDHVEQVLRKRDDLTPAQRKVAAQLAEGSPGVALTMDLAAAAELRKTVLQVLAAIIERRSSTDLFAETTRLTKAQKMPFETVLEVFYSLLNDLLELSAGFAGHGVRNPALGKELATLSRQVETAWIALAVDALDELGGRLRRNVNRQLGIDAIALSLSEALQK